MTIKIKDEFLGLMITKNIFRLQMKVTLDTTKEYTQSQLSAFYKFEEFKNIIEVVEEATENNNDVISYKGIEEPEEDKPTKKKRGRKPGSTNKKKT